MSKFTQGKWTAKGYTILDEQSVAIARISNVGWTVDTAQANTRLIEAAPEMYRMLKGNKNARELLARIDGEEEVHE